MAEKKVNKKSPGNSSAPQRGGQEDKEGKSTRTAKNPERSPGITEDKNMNEDLERFKTEIGKLAKSVVDGKLDVRADVNKFDGSYREMVQGVNNLIDAFVGPINVSAEYVDRISKGDIPEKITDEYKGDFNEIKNNINVLIDSLNALINEAATMEKAAAAGELDTRADVSKYNGAWATIVKGLNNTLEGVVVPLRDMGGVLDRMAAGDLKAQVVNEYQGDYNVLKVACNQLGTQLAGVQKVLDDLQGAIVEGKLDTRGDASAFKGDIAGMVNGLNSVIDAFVAPFNVVAEYVDRISKGDIPEKITDEYKGDFNEIKNNINVLIDSLNALINEAATMEKAAAAGELDTRADVSKYNGAWATIVKGLNNTLEGVIVLLRDMGGVLDRMAAGDLKAQVVNEYQGDYNVLKVACNQLGTQLAGVQKVLDDLQGAIVEGKLDTRGDASAFKGDIAGMVNGLNSVIDAFVAPFNVVAEYVDCISKGDIPEKITDEYKGDFNEIKNNLNELIDALNLIAGNAQRMAEGDLRVEIQPRSENDFLLKSLSKMVANLNESLAQVNIAVEQIAAGAGQVSDSAQALSQGATEQASALEEITSSMSEIAAQVKQNAENASQANQLCTEARSDAENGNDQMKEMIQAMEEINESSESISKIIKVIDEIAFQTNLLALNAAVEAARAGKHGKGFAVVAEEVRNLAARSAKAAKETAELIEGSMEKVGHGNQIANKTAEALGEIVTGVTKITDLVAEIAAASNEQAQGVSEINAGLGQIDQVTQQNTATAEQSASASEELSSQAVQLREMVARFKLARKNGKGGLPGMEQMTPEMMQTLQRMLNLNAIPSPISQAPGDGNGNKAKEENSRSDWGNTKKNTAGEGTTESAQPVIALDDKEFGRF